MNRLDVLAAVIFGGFYTLYQTGYLSFEETVLAYLFFIGLGVASLEAELYRGSE